MYTKSGLLVSLLLLVSCRKVNPTAENNAVTEVQPASGIPTLFENVSRAAGIVNTRRGVDQTIGQAWGIWWGNPTEANDHEFKRKSAYRAGSQTG